jgi:hypothetical protein
MCFVVFISSRFSCFFNALSCPRANNANSSREINKIIVYILHKALSGEIPH